MAKVQAQMSTEIALDLVKASQSIKVMTQLVNQSTSAWKAQEQQMKVTGDYLGAAEAKYNGLGNAIQAQQQKIERLRREQSELKGDTQETAQQYLKYEQQINQATTKLASLEAQQAKAKQAMDYQKSGLGDLQKEYREINDVSKSYVERLEAEGKKREAVKEKYDNSVKSIKNLTEQYEKQKTELKSLENSTDKSSSAYRTQQVRVNQTAAALAKAKTEQKEYRQELKSMPKGIFGQLRQGITAVVKKTEEANNGAVRMKGFFKAAFAANVISSAFLNGLSMISTKVKDLWTLGSEYNKTQQTMHASWLTLTGDAQKGEAMVKMTNEMALAAANSTEMVDALNQKIYSVTNNVEATKEQTQAILTLQDAFGVTDDAIKNFSVQWSQMIGNGKVQAQDMLSFVNVFPMFRQELKKTAAESKNMSEMTSEQYAKMQKDGEITSDMAVKTLMRLQEQYKGATKKFSETLPGFQRTIKARLPALVGDIQEGLNSVQNPFFASVAKWVSDPKIDEKMKGAGKSIGSLTSSIANSISIAFNLEGSDEKVSGLLDRVTQSLEKFAEYVNQHQTDLVFFFQDFGRSMSALWEIAKNFVGGIWDGLKTGLDIISGVFNLFTGKKSKEIDNSRSVLAGVANSLETLASHKKALQTLGKVMVALWATKKVIAFSKAISGVISIFGKLGSVVMAHPVIALIVGISAALVILYKNFKPFRDFVNGAAKKIGEVVSSIWKTVSEFFGKIADFFKNPLKGFSEFAGGVVKFAGTIAKVAGKSISGFVGGVVKGFAKFTGKALKGFGKFAGGVIDGAANMAKSAGKSISGFVSDSVKNVGKFAGSVSKNASKGFSSLKSAVSKAFGGSQKEAKKQTSKMSKETQKDIQKLVKHTQKQLKQLSKDSAKTFKDLPKTATKYFKQAEKQVKAGQKAIDKVLKAVDKSLKTFDKNYKKIFDDFIKKVNKDTGKAEKTTKDSVTKIQKLINSGDKWYKTLQKNTDKLAKQVDKVMSAVEKAWRKRWDLMINYSLASWHRIDSHRINYFDKKTAPGIYKTLDSIKSRFTKAFEDIQKSFKTFWDRMKSLSGQGMNATIAPLNSGIGGINSLIASFGGSKNAIKTIPAVKYETGTGAFAGISQTRRPITKPTLAVLNDGNDSPETGNQEMVMTPDGKTYLPQGRNVKMILPAGTEVFNATETRMLLNSNMFMRYADGTGFLGSIWDSIKNALTGGQPDHSWFGKKITAEEDSPYKEKMRDFIKDSAGDKAKTNFKAEMRTSADKMRGLFKPLAEGIFGASDKQGLSHWKTMWGMAEEAMAEAVSTVAMGATGDDYRYKHMAKDAGADPWGYFFRECVSFVASRLANWGVNPALFSGLGNGNQWVSARVPHTNKPQPGMVAVYAPGSDFPNHVAVVSAVRGNMYDGEEYNWGGDGNYHTFSNRNAAGATTFLDFGVRGKSSSSDDSKSDVKADTALKKLIKGQVGKMYDWIKENLGETTIANPEGGGDAVQRWRPYVVKALKANGIDPTAHRIESIMRTIQRESNGDPNVQNNWDSNAAAGTPSIGLMQTIGPTFNAYKHPGHDNIRNGYDNLLAAIAYIKARYGTSDAAFTRVASAGYANGGLVRKQGLYELAEGNMPEYVIPTDKAKRSRAWTLLAEVVGKFAGESGHREDRRPEDNAAISKLEAKFDAVISLLAQLVAGQDRPIEANFNVDGKSFAEALAPYSSKANANYSKRDNLIRGLT